MGLTGLLEARAESRRLVEDDGIRYGGLTDEVDRGRSWVIDPLPVVIGSEEWAGAGAGAAPARRAPPARPRRPVRRAPPAARPDHPGARGARPPRLRAAGRRHRRPAPRRGGHRPRPRRRRPLDRHGRQDRRPVGRRLCDGQPAGHQPGARRGPPGRLAGPAARLVPHDGRRPGQRRPGRRGHAPGGAPLPRLGLGDGVRPGLPGHPAGLPPRRGRRPQRARRAVVDPQHAPAARRSTWCCAASTRPTATRSSCAPTPSSASPGSSRRPAAAPSGWPTRSARACSRTPGLVAFLPEVAAPAARRGPAPPLGRHVVVRRLRGPLARAGQPRPPRGQARRPGAGAVGRFGWELDAAGRDDLRREVEARPWAWVGPGAGADVHRPGRDPRRAGPRPARAAHLRRHRHRAAPRHARRPRPGQHRRVLLAGLQHERRARQGRLGAVRRPRRRARLGRGRHPGPAHAGAPPAPGGGRAPRRRQPLLGGPVRRAGRGHRAAAAGRRRPRRGPRPAPRHPRCHAPWR